MWLSKSARRTGAAVVPGRADESLREHLEQGKAALRAGLNDRVHEALTVLPLLVADLERVALYQTELRDIREELVRLVGEFRRLVWDQMRTDPSATHSGAAIAKAARDIDRLLGRISELLGP